MLSAGLLLVACTSPATEVILDAPAPVEARSELRLRISLPNEVTLRGTGVSAEDPLQRVRQLRLAFYGATSGVVEHLRDIPIASVDLLQDVRVSLPPADYRLVAIANPSERLLQLTARGSALTLLETPQNFTTRAFTEEVAAKTYISMLNEQGAVAISAERHFASTASPVSLTLEPTLARVVVYGQPEVTRGSAGTGRARFLVAGAQRGAIPLRPLALLSGGTPEVAGDGSSRTLRYASSPHWQAWAAQTPTTTGEVYHFTPEQYAMSHLWANVPSAYDQLSGTAIESIRYYAREATLPPNAFLRGTTPCVIIAFPYIPSELTAVLQPSEGWLRYRGRVYGERAVRQALAAGGMPVAELSEIISALRAEGIGASDFGAGFSRSGIDFHHEGYSYYVVYIRHFATATDEAPYGRYGIVRGNEYRIHLKAVMDSGLPTPPDLTNALEPIAESRVVGLNLSVTSPIVRDQEVSL